MLQHARGAAPTLRNVYRNSFFQFFCPWHTSYTLQAQGRSNQYRRDRRKAGMCRASQPCRIRHIFQKSPYPISRRLIRGVILLNKPLADLLEIPAPPFVLENGQVDLGQILIKIFVHLLFTCLKHHLKLSSAWKPSLIRYQCTSECPKEGFSHTCCVE